MPDDRCKWKLDNFKCDGDSLEYDPDYYCILHSKNKDKDINAFTNKVNERIEREPNQIDLRGCCFPKKFPSNFFANIHNFNKFIYFSEAEFSGKISFSGAEFSQGADFSGAKFLGEANFWGAKFYNIAFFQDIKFSQDAIFQKTTFTRSANFSNTNFLENVYFNSAKFAESNFPKANCQKAFFIGTIFSKEANFYETEFSLEVDFRNAKFLQVANFSGATFQQKADFSETKFLQVAHFNRTTFSHSQETDFLRAEFSEVYFMGTTFKEGAKFSWTKFKDKAFFLPATDSKKLRFDSTSHFRFTSFLGEVIFQDVDLSQCSFLYSNIDRVDFRYCKFAKKKNRLFRITRVFLLRRYLKALLGEIKPLFRMIQRCILAIHPFSRENILWDELDRDIMVKTETNKKKAREKYEPVRRVYLELKRNFEEKKDWNTAGDFHFGEMECRRKMKEWLKLDFYLVTLYSWASGYGERPLRAFIGLLVLVLIIFPFFYGVAEGFCTNVWWDSVKVATFMRLGNPIEQGAGSGKFIVALFEIIFVPLQTALLALALRRKVKR